MIWLIIFAGTVLRILNLNQGLWLDEAVSALAVKNYSFVGIIKDFLPGDTHPPLYYWLLKLWSMVFGYGELPLRVLSVFLGIATVAFVYILGTKLVNKKVGVIASLLLATSPLHIYYSQEVRMYALSTFFIASSFYCFIVIVQCNKIGRWVLFSAFLLLVGLTDYLPLLTVPALWVYSLLSKKSSGWWKRFLACHIPLAVFLILWFSIFKQQSDGGKIALNLFPEWKNVLGGANLKELALVWIKFITGRIPFNLGKMGIASLGAASFAIIYALFRSREKIRQSGILWLWFIVPMATSFLGAIFVPGFSYFRLIFILPAFYLLIATGLDRSKFVKPIMLVILILNLAFSFVYIRSPKYWREDWRGAVKQVDSSVRPSEVILMAFPEPFAPYRWYSTKNEAVGYKNSFSWSEAEMGSEVENLVAGKQGVYIFEYLMDLTDPCRVSLTTLKNLGYREVETLDFRGVGQIRHFAR